MNPLQPASDVGALVAELVRLPAESEWVEFKENNDDPQAIGEYISALANSAALQGRSRAYLVWGVRDVDHQVVGTSVDPIRAKKGNEDLQNWLARLLNPRVHFTFRVGQALEGARLVVLEVDAAHERPVAFQGTEYIRVGSYKKKLAEHPKRERQLWRAFETRSVSPRL